MSNDIQLGGRTLDSLTLAQVELLMDHAPRATFSLKDQGLRYIGANRAMLDLCGVRARSELFGRTSRDFFPETARRRYENADRLVMRTRRPVQDQLDLTLRLRGGPVWVMLSRWPVIGPRRDVLGVAILARRLEAPDRRHPIYARLARALDQARATMGAPLDMSALARGLGVSMSQFERDFTGVFGMPPRRYITKMRLEGAIELLAGDKSIAEIAQACGYADQSAFARRFHAIVGMSPSQYRQTLASEACADTTAR